jgi:thioredoxin-dependent peroxiredoxin
MYLKAGDRAPDFRGITTDGKEVSLADYRGRKLILYFYPMDFSPICTMQACSLRDHNEELKAHGADILGISAQSASSHQSFARTHKLPFPLLADGNMAIARAYGVFGGGLFGMAKAAMGMADRVTFIIDEEGTIVQTISNPNVPRHGEELLRLVRHRS